MYVADESLPTREPAHVSYHEEQLCVTEKYCLNGDGKVNIREAPGGRDRRHQKGQDDLVGEKKDWKGWETWKYTFVRRRGVSTNILFMVYTYIWLRSKVDLIFKQRMPSIFLNKQEKNQHF